jgi:hypothetical protein
MGWQGQVLTAWPAKMQIRAGAPDVIQVTL